MENNNKQHNVALKQEDIDGFPYIYELYLYQFFIVFSHKAVKPVITNNKNNTISVGPSDCCCCIHAKHSASGMSNPISPQSII